MQPPSPTPAANRSSRNTGYVGAKAPSTENDAKINRVTLKARFRPSRSATAPQATAPTAIPTRLAVATSPRSAGARWKCSPSSGIRKPLRAMSYASKR
ncbi:hypothetical protein DC74_1451 [Streptomyces noursei]|nr:hypothetical protein DC74_1451 [Streptomyces noursei]